MLCRLVGNIVGGDVPAEVEERVEKWSGKLNDEECRVCGDLVGRLKDDEKTTMADEWWQVWPTRLRSCDGAVMNDTSTVTGRIFSDH